MAAVFEPEGAQIGKRLDDGARAIDLVDVRRPAAGDVEHIEVCVIRSEEHTSELQSLMRISYAVFCLKKKKTIAINNYQLPKSLTTQQSPIATDIHKKYYQTP